MLPEMGPPETTTWEYPMADDSWELEADAFLEDIRLGREPVPGINEAEAALRVVERVYEESSSDHSQEAAPDFVGRWRHRSAVLLPRSHRFCDRGSD
jgi:hypothetical protein